jgi:L-Ala-D/L-Glu epimerase
MAKIASFVVERLHLPLKRPFVTALGRKTVTENVAFTLTLSDGSRGYGEAASSLAMAHLSPAALEAALRGLGRMARGRDAHDWDGLADRAWKGWGRASPAIAAFEAALAEASLASLGPLGLSLRRRLGAALDRLESDVTLSAVDAESAAAAAREAAQDGFRILKIKLDGDEAGDWERITRAARAARKPRIYLDGNQGMTVRGALRVVERCLKAGLKVELLEQPLPKADLTGLRALSSRCPIPVALDETVQSPEDAIRAADARAGTVLNVKLAKCGLRGALRIGAVARAAGLELMIGCMSESAAGLSASAQLALGTGWFRYVDLDTDVLLAGKGRPRGWKRQGPYLLADD